MKEELKQIFMDAFMKGFTLNFKKKKEGGEKDEMEIHKKND